MNLKKFIKKQKELDDIYNRCLDAQLLRITTPFKIEEKANESRDRRRGGNTRLTRMITNMNIYKILVKEKNLSQLKSGAVSGHYLGDNHENVSQRL